MNNVLINVDLSQAELRTMAILSDDPWMIAALQEGQGDFFDEHLMPVAFPWILDDYGTVAEYKKQKPVEHKEDRTKVKAVQYGLAFGRQANAIAKELKMPVRDAQAIIDNYLSTAPKFAQWREDVQEAAINPAKRDLLVTPFGRRFQSEVVTTRNFRNVQREALSFLPQAISSDICLTTAMRIHPQLKEIGFHIFNIVHDAIMIEGPDYNDAGVDLGEFVGRELRKTGEIMMGTTVPYLSDYSIGLSWANLS